MQQGDDIKLVQAELQASEFLVHMEECINKDAKEEKEKFVYIKVAPEY